MKKITLLFFLFVSSLGVAQQQDPNDNLEKSKIQSTNISLATGADIENNISQSNTSNNRKTATTSEQTISERNNELVFLKLRLSASGNSYDTDIYFNDNASLGFDLGYDASFFGAIPAFVLYTELVEDNVGLALALQAVNTTDLFGVSIPLGVNSLQGEELTISIATSTLPANIEVYLDDTLANTSTLLNNSNYVLTPTSNLTGTGRFFLRTAGPSVTYTFNGSWSPNDPNGIATVSDNIIVETGNVTIGTNTSCNTVTVNPGAGLEISSGITLTTNNLTLESNATSYSSLILNGSVVGNMEYERHVNINGSGTTGSNDLVSAPLTGQQFNEVASANPNILNNGTLYLFGPFEKMTGQYITWAGTEIATLDPGVGYRAATTDNGTVTFNGIANNSAVNVDILNAGSNNEEWNLVGNPYPSYLNVQQFLLHDVGGVTNIQLFDAPTAAIYGYDGSALDGWTLYNLANTTASTVLAPGQGFFVSADETNDDVYDLEFTPAMRSTGTTDDFIVGRNAELSFVKLRVGTASNSYSTEFYFNSNASQGFDFGYDAELWGESTSAFAIYSHLVEDNQGKPIALQTLNPSDLSNVTIPLGLNANQGEQLTFSIAESTLSESVNVYLDDVVANTTTLLNNEDYVITPATPLSGAGRFFLRTSEDALSTIDNNLDAINIFALNNTKEIVVNGQLQENASLNLYDIQGRKVFSTELDATNLENRIDTSSLSAGVYVVTLKNNNKTKSQKLVIN